MCSIRLAVTSRVNRGGEWGDQSNYFDVTVFGRQAESAGTYLSKGRRIGVDGRLSWREWQSQDGTKRQAVEIIANDIFFLDSRGDGGGGGEYGQERRGWSDAPPRAAGGGGGDSVPVDTTDMAPSSAPSDDDDIPF